MLDNKGTPMNQDDRITPLDPLPMGITPQSDFVTIYGAVRYWYKRAREAERPRKWLVVWSVLAGIATGSAITQWLLR